MSNPPDTPPLIDSASKGDIDTCRALLCEGADVNMKDTLGRTPLMWASAFGRFEVCQLLIEAGADLEIRDMYHWTAFHHAYAPAVRALLDPSSERIIPARPRPSFGAAA